MTTRAFFPCLLSSGAPTKVLPEEAPPTLFQISPQVNSWPKDNACVEAARPSHCQNCDAPSRNRRGGIRLQGHGQRTRQVLGPAEAGAPPGCVVATVRRYRCTSCGATEDVSPPGLAKRYRYSLPAVATAFLLWAIWLLPANQVRAEISPHRFEGLNRNQRWRSLLRWARAAPRLFGFDVPSRYPGHREAALRAARWIRATRPPGGSERERIFIAAQVI